MLAKKVGKRIRHLRVDLELSQAELAAKIGTNSMTVSNWETGRCLVSSEFIYKMCEVFQLDLSFFNVPSEPESEAPCKS